MKYVQINAYAGGWANSVVFKKHRELLERGNESYVFWARGEHEQDEHMVKIATYPKSASTPSEPAWTARRGSIRGASRGGS